MNKKNQIIVVIILLVSAFAVYAYFNNSSEDKTQSTVVAGKKTVESIGAKEILAPLNRMSKTTLDNSIFVDKSFLSLEETQVVYQKQIPGRNNPFAPVGKDAEVYAPLQGTSSRKLPFEDTI